MFINMRGMNLSGLCSKLVIIASFGAATLFSDEFVLTVSPERAQKIEEIVMTMGQTNVIMLKFKEKHLRELSVALRGMGSFHFLGYIFSHPELKEQLTSIRSSYFKWNGFMESVRKGFDRQKAEGTLNEQIEGFARLVDVDFPTLSILVHQGDWDKLVSYLIDNAR